jgi:5-bromo-4-chloroindolyl phosphate hydrolysis protein
MVVPMGSVNELRSTQEDAEKWYKSLDDENHKMHNIKVKFFDFWAFKLFLLVASIWLIPVLRDVYNGVKEEPKELFDKNEE